MPCSSSDGPERAATGPPAIVIVPTPHPQHQPCDKVLARPAACRYATAQMLLHQLLQHARLATPHDADPHAPVLGVTEDSRTVRPGWVFIARPGTRTDGRRFIPDAASAGAVAVLTDASTPEARHDVPVITSDDPARDGAILAEAHAGSPSHALRLIGVTGTNGKSTVTSLISQLAAHSGTRCGQIGTVETDTGTGPTPTPVVCTTPAAERVSALLAEMVRNGCAAAAMEASSHALDQRRVAGVRFAAAVFTNLSGDHLDYHGTMAAYADAKAKLFENLTADTVAVVNAADPATDRMLRGCAARVVRCIVEEDHATAHAAAPEAALARIERTDSSGTHLTLSGPPTNPWGPIETTTRLLGTHNMMNLLQAFVVCVESLGLDPAQLADAVPLLRAPKGRLERVDTEADDLAVFIDFAHTDDALAAALRAARAATPTHARLWVLFGCGGNKDSVKRPRMGAVAAESADVVFLTSDNPRTEDPDAIISEIIAGVPSSRHADIRRDPDRHRAINAAIADAAPGDVIVIAGKGHEHEQVIPDGKGGARSIPFDEHRIVRDALRARKAGARPADTTPRAVNGGAA